MAFSLKVVFLFICVFGLVGQLSFGLEDEEAEELEVCGDRTWTARCVQGKKKGLCETDQSMKHWCPKTCKFCVEDENASSESKTAKEKGFGINEESCGKSVVPASRVVAGMDASAGEWPWQVWLNIEGTGFTCGGSLITREWVLTAAHCILETDRRLYQVVIGDLNRKTIEGSEQVFDIKRIIKHKFYEKPQALTNDVALLQLSRPAVLNNFVNTICLPKYMEVVKPGKRCFVSGWGMTHTPGDVATKLQQASLPVVSNQQCAKIDEAPQEPNKETQQYPDVTPAMLCAGDAGKTKKSACFGDSGGPFVCRNSAGRWVLQGVVSWGDSGCSSKRHYSVFARVSMFRQWIEGNIERFTE